MSRMHVVVLALAVSAASCTALRTRAPEKRDAVARLDRGLAALGEQRYGEAFDDLAWVYAHCPGHVAGFRAASALAALELDPRNPAGRPGIGTELLGALLRSPGVPSWERPITETGYLLALALGAPPAPVPVMGGDTAAPPAGQGTASAEHRSAASRPASSGTATTSVDTGTVAAGAGDTASATPQPPRALPHPPPPLPEEESVEGCGAAVTADDWVEPALPRLPGPSMAAILAEAEGRRDTLAERLAATRMQLDSVRDELERVRKTLKP